MTQANTGFLACTHEINRWAATVRFSRNYSVHDINDAHFWSSSITFLRRYISVLGATVSQPCSIATSFTDRYVYMINGKGEGAFNTQVWRSLLHVFIAKIWH